MASSKGLVTEQPVIAIQLVEEARAARQQGPGWGLTPVEMAVAAVLAGLLALPGAAVLYLLLWL